MDVPEHVKVHYIAFWPDAWLAATRGMSFAEVGAYWQICSVIYAKGGPVPLEELSRILNGRNFDRLFSKLLAIGKVQLEVGMVSVRRALAELDRSHNRTASALRAAAKRWKSHETGDADGVSSSNANKKKMKIREKKEVPNGTQKESRPKRPAPKPIPLDEWRPSGKHRELAYAEGRDDPWIDREADRYRDQQTNAKLRHRDREAGFRNWIRNAPGFEGKANGHAKRPSPVDTLYRAAFEAAEIARRQREAAGD